MAEDPNDPHKEEEGFEEEYEFEESEADSGSESAYSDVPAYETVDDATAFSEGNLEEHLTEPDLDMPPPPPEKKVRLLPTLIVLGILGFLGWKLIGFFTKPAEITPTPAQTPTPVAAKPLPAPAAQPVAPAAPASSLPTLENVPAAPTPEQEILAKVDKKLEEEKKLNEQRAHALETAINALSESSTNANKAMGQLQQELRELSASMRNIESQWHQREQAEERARRAAQAAKAAKLKKKEGPGPEAFANPSLTVYAIIPGRAWLKTPAGKTITVSEGDAVGEYGKVVKVDAVNGTVITSSGITLR